VNESEQNGHRGRVTRLRARAASPFRGMPRAGTSVSQAIRRSEQGRNPAWFKSPERQPSGCVEEMQAVPRKLQPDCLIVTGRRARRNAGDNGMRPGSEVQVGLGPHRLSQIQGEIESIGSIGRNSDRLRSNAQDQLTPRLPAGRDSKRPCRGTRGYPPSPTTTRPPDGVASSTPRFRPR